LNKKMVQSNNNSTAKPVLIPPDGGRGDGKGNHGSGRSSNWLIVFAGFAALLVLAALVIFLPSPMLAVSAELPVEVISSDNPDDIKLFKQAVARAMAALSEERFSSARLAVQEAMAIRPDDPVIVDLLEQVSRKELNAKLVDLRDKSIVYENEEKWQQAVNVCQQALKLSATAAFAVACKERAQERLELDIKLQSILAQPERLFSKGSLHEAIELRIFVMSSLSPGPILAGQINHLSALIDQAEADVEVLIISDDFTDIVIYHVGRLGCFTRKWLVLATGNYTLVGSRQGFRDVRQTLHVRPDGENVFTVYCEEPI
jgi:hypothetical protein